MKSLPAFTPSEALAEREGIVTLRGALEGYADPVLVRVPARDDTSATARSARSARSAQSASAQIEREWSLHRGLGAEGAFGVPRALGLAPMPVGRGLVLADPGGTPLDALLRREGRLDLGFALRIAISIARTFEGLHARRIVYAGLDPATTLIDPASGRVSLFGFALAERLAPGAPGEPVRRGSPEALEFAAPEQTGRMSRPVDARADLYSLGIVLYALLTGAPPFTQQDPLELVHAHLARPPVPPKEAAPGVPALLSDLTLRLLAKMPEDRYRSARGVRLDLERALTALTSLEEGGALDFPLAEADVAGTLAEPDKLLGREAELSALTNAFVAARAGEARAISVTGPAGIGKSALAAALGREVTLSGGHWAKVTLEKRGSREPLAALATALSLLARSALAEPADRFHAIGRRLLRDVGARSGRAVVDLVPELGLVLGPQPPLPETGPDEAHNRQILAAEACLRALATAERPVVLCFEDAQWADPASLDLLAGALAGRRTRHLLIVFVYREEDVFPGHPLTRLFGAREADEGRVALGPLGLAVTTELVREMLGVVIPGEATLAEIVFEKTGGSPFFTRELLHTLFAEGLLRFDAAASTFRFHEGTLRAATLAGDVTTLVTERLARLGPSARETLCVAAALGREIDEATLAFVQEKPIEEVRAALEEAIEHGIVAPGFDAMDGARDARPRFSHGRVKQAAYARIPVNARPALHLSLGRRLRAMPAGAAGERIFEALSHLRLGRSAVTDETERRSIARLEKEAGERAKAKIAYESARDHFAEALEWLGPGAWQDERDLAFRLHAELAECEALCGRTNEAVAHEEELSLRATGLERARIDVRRVALFVRKAEFSRALEAGLAALSRMGIEIAEGLEGEARPSPALTLTLDAPNLTEERDLVVEELLLEAALPAYYTLPRAFERIVDTWLSFVSAKGHSDRSAFGYALRALSLVGKRETLEGAYALGRFALALDARRGKRALTCKITETFAGNVAFFRDHLRAVLALFPDAIDAGLAAGDFTHVAYICYHQAAMRLGAGDELGLACEQIDAHLELALRTRDTLSAALVRVAAQTARNLLGRTESTRTLSGEGFTERDLDSLGARPDFAVFSCFLDATRCALAVVYGRFDEALAHAERAEATSAGLEGQFFSTHFTFFAAIARLCARGLAARDEPAFVAHLDRLRDLGEACPDNYRHLELAVSAELARLEARHGEARELYDEALEFARKNEFPHHEAILAELAARYYTGREKSDAARVYLARARDGYQRWGALAKVAELDHAYPALLRAGPTSVDLDENTVTSGRGLDAVAVVRAAETIAGEMDFERLLERLMRTILALAGADHGALVLAREGALSVEAVLGAAPAERRIGLSDPIDVSRDVAASVVHYVARTRAPLALSNPAEDARFAKDARLLATRPASALGLPLVHRGALAGVVYLENRTAHGVFGKDRVEILGLLSSQAAIAVENALLVADVRARTSELATLNAELRRELDERERSERERAFLQQGIIEMQKARLAELRTPFIPVSHDVMVMPLIGTLDSARAEEALSVALAGTTARGARVVILDVTGVKVMDEIVARTLLKMVSALGLVGAKAIVTGIRGDVARTLVDIDADFSVKVTTKSTLEAGIRHALGGASRRA